MEEPLIRIPKSVFRDEASAPTQVPDILNWVEDNPTEFRILLDYFDRVIQDFNSRTTDKVDVSNQNFHMIKTILGNQQLPTIQILLTERGINPIRQYRKIIINIKEMMYSGQKPAEERIEPWVAYHTTETSLKNLVIASIFHTYEELIKTRVEFQDKKFESDRIIEALMEIAAEQPKPDLFTALASKDGMNWVDNYDRFTVEFRQRNGFD